jgi:FtsP/CotA-like multicopper oxidase with cupredoxin domain
MSGLQRAGLVVGVAAVAAVAFLLARPDDEEPAKEAPVTTSPDARRDATGEGASPPERRAKPRPAAERIEVRAGKPVGGAKEITVQRGDVVRLRVTSKDTTEEVHVHGYDLIEGLSPGAPARFRFAARIEGIFEIELEGTRIQIARLVVEPS